MRTSDRGLRAAWMFSLILLVDLGRVPPASAAPPPARLRGEVEAVLARSPGPPPGQKLRPLKIVLLANEKDHGPEEHDYPLWQKRWAELLGGTDAGAPGVSVSTAWGWPGKEDLQTAHLIVSYTGTSGRWNRQRIEDLGAFLDRGGGYVAIHSTCIADRELSRPLAALIGLAWEDGTTTFRHGPLELAIAASDHPICLGLPQTIRFEDETYWPLVGDPAKVEVLVTASEPSRPRDPGSPRTPQPMFWTFQRGPGRVFCSILGHYTWTFDDPYFRLLLLRGMAWAARESPYRFDPLILRGARVREAKEESSPRKAVRAGAPDPKDPRLVLWLDASDRSSVAVDLEGFLSRWSSKAGARRGLWSSLAQRPRYVADGPGGRATVRFDGKDDLLRDTDFHRSAVDWTLFLVAAVRSNAGNFRALFAANRTGANDYLSGINLDLGYNPSTFFDTLNLEGAQHEEQSNLKNGPTPFGTYVIAVSRGGGLAQAFLNGAPEGERRSADKVASLDEVRLSGRLYENPPGKLPLVERGFLDGDISEVILYEARLSGDDRESIQAYLEEKYREALVEVREPTLEEALERLPKYEVEKGRAALASIDAALWASHGDPAARSALAARLESVLTGGATRDAKDFACRRLSLIGSARSVPALATLLGHEGLSHIARFALERISGPEAARALRDALDKVGGRRKVGIINSLGRLGDRESVPRLAALLRDPDPEVVTAAVLALGDLGATAHLWDLLKKGSGAPAAAVAEALLDLADRLLRQGRRDEAIRISKELSSLDQASPQVRAAAARMLKERETSGEKP